MYNIAVRVGFLFVIVAAADFFWQRHIYMKDMMMSKYDVKGNVTGEMEANGHCVEPGMPTVMWGIGGAAMEIVQQPQRVTLLSELANQSRRIFLDGRAFPTDVPEQRVGYSIGHWEGDTLVIETRNIMEWHAPRWPHSNEMRIVERWSLKDPSELKITGLPRPAAEDHGRCSSTR
jgi:hypothetical protein